MRITTIAQDKATLGPASPAQFQLISNMAKERGIDVAKIFNRPANWKEAKVIINWLKAQPKKVAETETAPATPTTPQYDGLAPKPKDGKKARGWHYALTDQDGTVKFYRVKRGYKEGFYFVDAQASDDYYPIRNRAHREEILSEIAKDIEGALALYGREVGRCGRCGRTLTSEYRKLGIGPVCIDK